MEEHRVTTPQVMRTIALAYMDHCPIDMDQCSTGLEHATSSETNNDTKEKLCFCCFFLSATVCPWLDFGLPPRCPQVVVSGRVGRVQSAKKKSLELLHRDWELNLGHGEDRQ